MIEIKKDCFAYMNESTNKGCNALKKLYCAAGKCPFYKTHEQLKNECETLNVAIHEDYIKEVCHAN